jgi:hypothetical protein
MAKIASDIYPYVLVWWIDSVSGFFRMAGDGLNKLICLMYENAKIFLHGTGFGRVLARLASDFCLELHCHECHGAARLCGADRLSGATHGPHAL